MITFNYYTDLWNALGDVRNPWMDSHKSIRYLTGTIYKIAKLLKSSIFLGLDTLLASLKSVRQSAKWGGKDGDLQSFENFEQKINLIVQKHLFLFSITSPFLLQTLSRKIPLQNSFRNDPDDIINVLITHFASPYEYLRLGPREQAFNGNVANKILCLWHVFIPELDQKKHCH